MHTVHMYLTHEEEEVRVVICSECDVIPVSPVRKRKIILKVPITSQKALYVTLLNDRLKDNLGYCKSNIFHLLISKRSLFFLSKPTTIL